MNKKWLMIWSAYGAIGATLEAVAKHQEQKKGESGDTLSEQIWWATKLRILWFACALVMAWLTQHFLFHVSIADDVAKARQLFKHLGRLVK